jgi:hypothetical protein
MPSVEEILAALQAETETPDDDDDADVDGDGGTGAVVTPDKDSKAITEIRAALRRKEADLKAERAKSKERDALLVTALEFQKEVTETQRKSAVIDVFRTVGLKEKTANLYTGEPDEAQIKQWALDNDLIADEGEIISEDTGSGFAPTVVNDGKPPLPQKLTHEQAKELLRTDIDLYNKMFDAGRITLNTVPE